MSNKAREEKLEKRKRRMKKHGKSLASIYKNAIEKRSQNERLG